MNFKKVSTSELIVLREERKIDISPNLKYIIVPNLDDKKIPISFLFSWEANFNIIGVYGGSFASVNCIKFMPVIFYKDGYEYMYFVTGDAHGTLAFWEHTNNISKQEGPILIFRTDDIHVTIDSIDFSRDG